jgi:hypothetical protein
VLCFQLSLYCMICVRRKIIVTGSGEVRTRADFRPLGVKRYLKSNALDLLGHATNYNCGHRTLKSVSSFFGPARLVWLPGFFWVAVGFRMD